jgi:hypothetical protein
MPGASRGQKLFVDGTTVDDFLRGSVAGRHQETHARPCFARGGRAWGGHWRGRFVPECATPPKESHRFRAADRRPDLPYLGHQAPGLAQASGSRASHLSVTLQTSYSDLCDLLTSVVFVCAAVCLRGAELPVVASHLVTGPNSHVDLTNRPTNR